MNRIGALVTLFMAACFLITSMPGSAVDCPLCPRLQITEENTGAEIGNVTYSAQLLAEPASFGTKTIYGKIVVAKDGSYAYDLSDSAPEKLGITIKSDDIIYDYVDASVQAVNQPEGMAAIADLMYFRDGAPSLADVAKAVTWAFNYGTKQVPTNMMQTTVGNTTTYPAMMESITSTPFIGGSGYLVQVQVNEKAIFCLATNFANCAEMGRTIEFGGF